MVAGGRTIRSYAPARCDALGVGRRDDNMIDDLDIERSTKVGKPARRDDVVFARGRVAARVIVDENESGGAVLDRAPKDRSRSEERRVGKEGVSTCRSRGSPYH